MIRNYLKISWRNLLKNKAYTFINIFGLSIGLACFSLFLLYAVNEFSFDRFHEKKDDIYQVYRWIKPMNGNDSKSDAYLPMPLAPALKEDFPDVENYLRFKTPWGENFIRANKAVTRAELTYADPQMFEMLTFPLKYGDPATALKELNSLVLTEKMAIQLFGESNPIGRTVEIKLEETFEIFTITAIAENIPPNSSITFDLLANFEKWASSSYGEKRRENWGHSAYLSFVQLREGSGLATDADRLLDFRKKYYPSEEADYRERGLWKEGGAPVLYRFQPITAVHTNTDISWGMVSTVNPKNIWILLAIAAGVLLIACINFTTLAIGRSAGRAKEVGVRKVIGSGRIGLIKQFLTEALFLSSISIGIGLALGQFLLPWFNQVSGRELSFSLELYPEISWLIVGLTLIVALLSGGYPALVLSGFKPIEVFKSNIKLGGTNFFTRSLVVIQFVLSISLIISTIVVMKQLDFMKSENPGFNKENIVVIDAEEIDAGKIYPLFRQKAIQYPAVKAMGASDLGLGAGTGWSRVGFDYKEEPKEVFEYFIDENFIEVLDLQVLVGRNFDVNRSEGANLSIIINEAMMKDFGWTLETAIGKELVGFTDEGPFPKVIGVVKDFNFRSFHEDVEPQMFHQFEGYVGTKFFVRLEKGDPSLVLSDLQENWASFEPELPFKYSFLEEDFDRFYRAESRLSHIITWAGSISIFLACLGLFGLVSLTVVNRTKEIGIRKVLGATMFSIMNLLSINFLKLVGLSLLIAIPVSWYFMNNWLENFAYRISLEWWIFLLSGLITISIALLTVGAQSIKAALANPVDSLRTE